MADQEEVMRGINRKLGVNYPVLTPNLKGYRAAVGPKKAKTSNTSIAESE